MLRKKQNHCCSAASVCKWLCARASILPEPLRATQCAVSFTNLYEECFAELGSPDGAPGEPILFPDGNPTDGRNEYEEFYDTCNAAIHPKTEPDSPGTGNGLGTCVDDPTFAPASTCVDAYDQTAGKGACQQALTSMGYTCADMPAGYCDRTCGQCAGICPMLGPGQPNGCNSDPRVHSTRSQGPLPDRRSLRQRVCCAGDRNRGRWSS